MKKFLATLAVLTVVFGSISFTSPTFASQVYLSGPNQGGEGTNG
jgi:hypothetical protein